MHFSRGLKIGLERGTLECHTSLYPYVGETKLKSDSIYSIHCSANVCSCHRSANKTLLASKHFLPSPLTQNIHMYPYLWLLLSEANWYLDCLAADTLNDGLNQGCFKGAQGRPFMGAPVHHWHNLTGVITTGAIKAEPNVENTSSCVPDILLQKDWLTASTHLYVSCSTYLSGWASKMRRWGLVSFPAPRLGQATLSVGLVSLP